MWVNGEIVNNPSDGDERPVADKLIMVFVEPMQKSATYTPEDKIQILREADLYSGPGSNFNTILDLEPGMKGIILKTANKLNKILAKRSFWWKVSINGTEGWMRSRAFDATERLNPISSILGTFIALSNKDQKAILDRLDE